jgi:signal transduction histidine kinase
LRQPLYSLTLFTEALQHKSTYPESLKITHKISRSVDALQTLLDALLDISVLDASAVDVLKSDFMLNQITDKLAFDFNPLAAEKNIFAFNGQPNLAGLTATQTFSNKYCVISCLMQSPIPRKGISRLIINKGLLSTSLIPA